MKTGHSWIVAFLVVVGCNQPGADKILRVKNSLPIERSEVISIPLEKIAPDTTTYSRLTVMEGEKTVLTQLTDSDYDGRADQLLAYITIEPGEERTYRILNSKEETSRKDTLVFSRFVPERVDDYAWENDRVAFRTYGPEAQRLVDESQPGGTLSSGIDCWLKKVDYPVINKWYKKYTDGGTYHTDDGEGYDPYHVGLSRGCGGIGVRIDDSLFVSKNFVSWKKLADGPVRVVFELAYQPWQANGITIRETKRISIDAGSQLTLIEELVGSSEPIPHITVGLTLHDAKGETFMDSVNGVFGYWEKIDDAYLGTGIVIDPEQVLLHGDYRTVKRDQSHIFVNINPEGSRKYYAGFGWEKAGRITSRESWQTYLEQFSTRLRSPVIVTIE